MRPSSLAYLLLVLVAVVAALIFTSGPRLLPTPHFDASAFVAPVSHLHTYAAKVLAESRLVEPTKEDVASGVGGRESAESFAARDERADLADDVFPPVTR